MKTQPSRSAIVRISDPAMAWHEVDLNELLGCCRRELALRERCYPRWIDKGTIKPGMAERELELMRSVCDFLTHCIFKAVTLRTQSVASQEFPTEEPPSPQANTEPATSELQSSAMRNAT